MEPNSGPTREEAVLKLVSQNQQQIAEGRHIHQQSSSTHMDSDPEGEGISSLLENSALQTKRNNNATKQDCQKVEELSSQEGQASKQEEDPRFQHSRIAGDQPVESKSCTSKEETGLKLVSQHHQQVAEGGHMHQQRMEVFMYRQQQATTRTYQYSEAEECLHDAVDFIPNCCLDNVQCTVSKFLRTLSQGRSSLSVLEMTWLRLSVPLVPCLGQAFRLQSMS